MTTPDGTGSAAQMALEPSEPTPGSNDIDNLDAGDEEELGERRRRRAGPRQRRRPEEEFTEESYRALADEISAQPGQGDEGSENEEPGLLDGVDPEAGQLHSETAPGRSRKAAPDRRARPTPGGRQRRGGARAGLARRQYCAPTWNGSRSRTG